MNKLIKNKFLDIHKFPKEWGIIVFPISMTRIANALSPRACIDALDFFINKIQVNQVGAQFIYSEGLYMNFEQDAYETKNKFAQTAVSHMGGVRNLVDKNYRKFQINAAFSFESWFQMYLSHKDFFKAYKAIRDLYNADPEFQKYVAKDSKEQGKELTNRQVSFFLEEHTFVYLLLNKELRLHNDFVNGREQWILFAYPGKPPRGQIYLFQKDPLNLNVASNPYKGQYDLIAKKFIDYQEVDLNNFQY
ncbi:MAG: hypothetical protein Q7R94_01370 [bacterium]|nr:hypothetical protein [bacterium]